VADIEMASAVVAGDEHRLVVHRRAGGERLRGGQLLRVDRLAVLVAQVIDLGCLKIGTPISARPRSFCAGGLMKTVRPSPSTSMTPSAIPAIIASVRRTCRAIEPTSDCSMRRCRWPR
jgi:hypothetical protein